MGCSKKIIMEIDPISAEPSTFAPSVGMTPVVLVPAQNTIIDAPISVAPALSVPRSAPPPGCGSAVDEYTSPGFDPALSDSTFYEVFDLDMVDYDEDSAIIHECEAVPADFTNDALDRMLEEFAPSSEVNLSQVAAGSQTMLVAPTVAAMMDISGEADQVSALASLSVSKSSSCKRKLQLEETDTACSDMPASSKKRLHD